MTKIKFLPSIALSILFLFQLSCSGEENLNTQNQCIGFECEDNDSSKKDPSSQQDNEDSANSSDKEKPVCGNGIIEENEECDESIYNGTGSCSLSCKETKENLCGNGQLDLNEECDSGSIEGNEICDKSCKLRPEGPKCGNKKVEEAEECDDGNLDNGDGCNSLCKKENPSSVCGNGIIENNEECDDSNTKDADGCSSVCKKESQTAVCGNGVIENNEECDDSNKKDGDGCSKTCKAENSSAPQKCGSSISYARITHTLSSNDTDTVDHHPSKEFALIADNQGKVLKYDTKTGKLSDFDNLKGDIKRLRFSKSGDFAILSGYELKSSMNSKRLGKIYIYDSTSDKITALSTTLKLDDLDFVDISFNAEDAYLIANKYSSLNRISGIYIYLYEAKTKKLSLLGGRASNALGATGIAYGKIDFFPVLLISMGINTAGLYQFNPADKSWKADIGYGSKGNCYGVRFRPGKNEAWAISYSGDLVGSYSMNGWNWIDFGNYVYWHFNAIEFNDSGTSALVAGQSWNNQYYLKYFNGKDHSKGNFSDANINPWYSGRSGIIEDISWAPGKCEGLITGSKGNGTNSYGTIYKFKIK